MSADALTLPLPEELVEAVAQRAAEIVCERLPSEPEPWVGVEQAAAYLDCQPHRIYDLKRQGKLAHRKDGSRLLFRRSDLDAALDAE